MDGDQLYGLLRRLPRTPEEWEEYVTLPSEVLDDVVYMDVDGAEYQACFGEQLPLFPGLKDE